jgi:hypothetical protein
MCRFVFVAAVASLLSVGGSIRADAFDRYINPILAKAPAAAGVQEIKQLTSSLLVNNEGVLPDAAGTLIVVKTNEGRNSKLLVQVARQKINGQVVPILIVDRFVTFKDGEERAVQAAGQSLHLFPGFHFNLDLGQVVPASLGGDLNLVADGNKVYAEPLGKAKLYLITRPLPGTESRKTDKLVIGEPFEPRFFNGTYKLHDDGRRSGSLTLKVSADGEVTGDYFSDKDGQKYEVFGKVGTPRHAIQFTVKFPRVEQVFQGWLFTGDGAALTGSSRMQDRETGFYALRVEQD